MYVPEHLTATGDELRHNEKSDKNSSSRMSVLQQMEVPDKITVTGDYPYSQFDDERQGNRYPKDYKTILKDVPDVLTVADTAYPEVNTNRPYDTPRTENSLAVEEDPLRELKILRKKTGYLNSRLYQLEEEQERRSKREKFYLFGLIGLTVATIISLLRR